LILFIYFALNKDLKDGIQPLALMAILPFAIAFSSANTLYRHSTFPKWLRFFIHYALTVGGAFLFLYLPNKDPQQKASAAFILFLVFTVIYLVIMITVLVISARIHRVKRDEGKYHSVYKK
jgi:threonine/homoserine/homoserine lactone efflux protein